MEHLRHARGERRRAGAVRHVLADREGEEVDRLEVLVDRMACGGHGSSLERARCGSRHDRPRSREQARPGTLVLLVQFTPWRILAFWASNSASVRTPEAFSSPRLLELLERIGGGSRRGGGLLVLLLGTGPGRSWPAQRFAWRRETRFETAVAVPAITAVRATPRSKGICLLPFYASAVSSDSAASSRSATGMRSPRNQLGAGRAASASANGRAQRFSYSRIAAEAPGFEGRRPRRRSRPGRAVLTTRPRTPRGRARRRRRCPRVPARPPCRPRPSSRTRRSSTSDERRGRSGWRVPRGPRRWAACRPATRSISVVDWARARSSWSFISRPPYNGLRLPIVAVSASWGIIPTGRRGSDQGRGYARHPCPGSRPSSRSSPLVRSRARSRTRCRTRWRRARSSRFRFGNARRRGVVVESTSTRRRTSSPRSRARPRGAPAGARRPRALARGLLRLDAGARPRARRARAVRRAAASGAAGAARPRSPPSRRRRNSRRRRSARSRGSRARSRAAAATSSSTARPGAARPRSTSAHARRRSRRGAARSCSCPRSR